MKNGYFTECHNRLTAYNGTIESPNYPESYPRYADCAWIIDSQRGSNLTFHFADFNLEGHSTCNYDYIEVLSILSNTFKLFFIIFFSQKFI